MYRIPSQNAGAWLRDVIFDICQKGSGRFLWGGGGGGGEAGGYKAGGGVGAETPFGHFV